MYDLMQSQREAVRPYGLNRTEDLLARLERLAGGPITDDRSSRGDRRSPIGGAGASATCWSVGAEGGVSGATRHPGHRGRLLHAPGSATPRRWRGS